MGGIGSRRRKRGPPARPSPTCVCGRPKSQHHVAFCRDCHNRRRHDAMRRLCEHCGIAFYRSPHSRDARRFCSKKCRGAARTKARVAREAESAQRCARCGQPRRRGVRWCDACRLQLREEAGVRQRAAARERSRRQRDRPDRICEYCGQLFSRMHDARRRRFCSTKCSKCFHRGLRRHRRGHNKDRDRARRAGVVYEPVSRLRVFTRDGWRCQLCGCSTPKRLQGKLVDCAPELDHIIPLSAGGPHVWDNVQCACRACNGQKAAQVRGQLRLMLNVKAITRDTATT